MRRTPTGARSDAYGLLVALDDSPVVALNRAVALAMAAGPAAGLALVDEQAEALDGFHLLHAARADLLRRLDRREEAVAAYERALELAANPVERAFLARRLEELRGARLSRPPRPTPSSPGAPRRAP